MIFNDLKEFTDFLNRFPDDAAIEIIYCPDQDETDEEDIHVKYDSQANTVTIY